MNKRLMLIAAGLTTLSMFSHSTSANDSFVDYARVTQVTPIYQVVERNIPQESCWVERIQEETPRRNYNSKTGTIVGAVIGGAIGHRVGHGHDNKKLGTVVGSILGASIGRDISHRHATQHNHGGYQETTYRNVERCETTYTSHREREVVAYDVTYRYGGRTYTTEMDHDPGKKMKVSVQVAPLQF